MEFVGRVEEKKIIKYLIESDGYKGCVIYGRRRLGKTELIKHCLSEVNSPIVFFQCKESSEEDNTDDITILINQAFGLDHLHFKSFIEALSYVFELSIKQKVILVIDEYPYIRDLIKGCDSKIQELIDKYQNNCQLKFFLLGSSISTMEDVLSSNKPLYQRFNQTILLKQMDYYDSSLFYPSFTNSDKVKLYSAFGGVPYYNVQIDSNQTVEENIIRILSGKIAGLKDYVETYLKAELRQINNANNVFEAIALGAFHYTDILNKTNIDSSPILNTVLSKLIKMDLIEKISPINDYSNKQKSGYQISDYSLRFYYNYIYRNSSPHNILDDNVFYNEFIDKDFNYYYVPHVFEAISKQYLIRKNKLGLIEPILLDIGTYWYDDPIKHLNGQFDVVGKNQNGYVFFECKYTNNKLTDKTINEEINQISSTTLKPVQYGFISKSGFNLSKDYPYIFISLDEMYQ